MVFEVLKYRTIPPKSKQRRKIEDEAAEAELGVGNNESKQDKIDGVDYNESKQCKTDGVGELKRKKHLTQVQADEEVENETAEPCRMFMDDDEAERKKKKNTIAEGQIEPGSSWQPGLSAEQLNKTSGNIEQVIPAAQPESSVTSLENISRDPKEVESVLGERTFSGKFNSESDVKEGHMRTNKNCPRYGKDSEPQLKPTNNSNMRSPTLADQPMQVDHPEECGEAEAGNYESKQGQTDGVGELKMQKHLTQVQADEEVENETAEPCRMLMDDDEAEQKKKKNTIAEGRVESGSSRQPGSSAEQLNKANGNIEQVIPTAQPDSSVTLLENLSRDPRRWKVYLVKEPSLATSIQRVMLR
ncbi:uncharacterized protein LOC113344269 isoform X2 [Papaver somniferum]|uniref:uncharacterized protein LOC113344269 isoform X2 n=1 Tax=Papaver somniferum TaxID=3469 RepID=UPI000E6FAED1|nr:uncharacterized protein LOC113344269 isoform X2 [Papaver somniferum]